MACHTNIYSSCGIEGTCIVLSHFEIRGEAGDRILHVARLDSIDDSTSTYETSFAILVLLAIIWICTCVCLCTIAF